MTQDAVTTVVYSLYSEYVTMSDYLPLSAMDCCQHCIGEPSFNTTKRQVDVHGDVLHAAHSVQSSGFNEVFSSHLPLNTQITTVCSNPVKTQNTGQKLWPLLAKIYYPGWVSSNDLPGSILALLPEIFPQNIWKLTEPSWKCQHFPPALSAIFPWQHIYEWSHCWE